MTQAQNIEEKFIELLEQFKEASPYELRDHLYAHPWTPKKPTGPYPWQVEFHNAGSEYPERAIIAGNQTGKTLSGAAEVSYHATGDYPKWWKGKRFDHPTDIWVGSKTNLSSRDIVQAELLGDLTKGPDRLGTGMIPKRYLEESKPIMRQCGINGVVDSIKIKHASGGYSTIGFLTYEMGWELWQGTRKDVVWFDEEPPERVYAEGQTRTVTKKGVVIMTFTPLSGMGEVVRKFWNHKDYTGVWMRRVTWDDAPHLDHETKEQMLASFPPYLRDAKTKGLPTMGSGVIFPFHDDDITCKPFEIPRHYRQICGVDFGINHPAAAVWLAQDVDSGVVYVTDGYKAANEGSAYHAARIKKHRGGDWIPVAWPHDGMNREKSGGKTLADAYRENGANMMALSARFDDDAGGSQSLEDSLMDIYNLMVSGQFKVFSHLYEWLQEKATYHRDDKNRVVAEHDDLISATRYALMMIRYAISEKQANRMKQPLTVAEGIDYDPTEPYAVTAY